MNTLSRFLTFLLLACGVSLSPAQVPPMLNYQGSLQRYGTNFTGAAQFKFALVNAAGSQTFWSNDGTSTNGNAPKNAVVLGVTNGTFQLLLGDSTIPQMTSPVPATIFSNLDVRLRIWCTDGSTGFQPLSPDQRVVSVGYAMRADTAGLALSLAPGVVTNTGSVTRINTGPGLAGGPITSTGTLFIASGAISNAMLQNPALTITAGSGLTGGGAVPLGSGTTLALNLHRDATLTGDGAASNLGIDLTSPNTWSGTQTFTKIISGSVTGLASGFSGSLAGDVTGSQGATVITNLSASRISGLFRWQTVAGTSQQTVPNSGYILTNTAQVTLVLPTNPVVGDTVRLSTPGAGGWKLAQNSGQSVFAGNFESLQIGVSWFAHPPSAAWTALAASASGNQLVGAVAGGFVYVSTDSGSSWFPRALSTNWSGVSSSADGVKLAAVVKGGFVYTSADSGATWNSHSPSTNWYGIASSADGAKLAAVVNNGMIYTSTDSGLTWTPRQSAAQWLSVASSADGTHLAAGVNGGQIYFSTDSGVTWLPRGPGGGWCSIAASADGTQFVAVSRGGRIYTFTDSGTNWTARATALNWYSVASSSDGSRLVAVVNGGQIFNSVDSGLTWTNRQNNLGWQAVTCSADGATIAAAVNPGQIYVAPAPIVSQATMTTIGTQGYLIGDQGTALELQYIGNNQFLPLSYIGRIQSF